MGKDARIGVHGEIRDENAPPMGRFGPYELLFEIGRGGQGTVYLARDPRLKRRVALKVLSLVLAGSSEATERFEREAEAVSQLDHPGICTVYEAGEVDGTHFIAMRYLEGRTLADGCNI